MSDNSFDLRNPSFTSRQEIGWFLVAGGLGGMADAVWNVAPFAEPLSFAPLPGFVVGLLRLLTRPVTAPAPPPASKPGEGQEGQNP